MKPRAYLLAAGNGRRAGGPKAWALHEGRTLLEKQLDFLRPRFGAEGISVSIQAAWNKRCAAIDGEVRWTPADPQASPLQTLQTLLKAEPLSGPGFVYHVDMPVWEPDLFDALAEVNGEAVVPVHKGKRGHPVILSPELQDPILALDPALDRLDHWLRSRRVSTVEVPFACILENWNHPVHA